MHLRSLRLRNYRVYRAADLEFPDGLVGVYGPNGAGKCLPAHVRIFDADAGGMVTIEQFVQGHHKRTLGLSNGRIQPVDVIDWVALGERPTVEVTLQNGAQIEVAETHPILTDQGCVQAKDLTAEHWVAEADRIPALGPPRLTIDEALLLGLLLGDGSLSSTGIVLTAGNEAVRDLYCQLVERLFPGASVAATRKPGTDSRQLYVRSGLDVATRRRLLLNVLGRLRALDVPLEIYVRQSNLVGVLRGDRGLAWETLCAIEDDYGIDLFMERCCLYPARAILEWVRSLGLLGSTAGDKHIPPDLLTMPNDHVWALLGGLWLTDGWLRLRGMHPQAALCAKSRRLAEDVRLLLRRVGVRASVQRRIQRGSLYWNVSLAKDSLPRLSQMPLVGVKAERRDRILQLPVPTRRGNNGDLIPPSFNQRITSWSASTGNRRDKQQRHYAMNRSTYREFAGAGSVAEQETVWSPVVSVRPTGRSVPCYDIEVDTEEHLYLAGTFVVHNSTLIESIRYALFGDARTEKSELRSAGVNEDVRVELVFEHEGNTYEVRRLLKGRNLTPSVEVYVNQQLAAQSVRDANAYLGRVLGMDQRAFLASVCAQQKELTTFATMVPTERRRLVLDLLGVSPIERALARTREEGRDARTAAGAARAQLPDLPAAEAAAAEAAEVAGVAAKVAAEAGALAEAAGAALAASETTAAEAEAAARTLDELRQRAVLARAESAGARAEAQRHERRALEAEALAPELARAEAAHAELAEAAAPLPALEEALAAHMERQGLQRALQDAAAREQVARRALAEAERESAATAGLIEARARAEAAVERVEAQLVTLRERHAAASEALGAAAARLETARGAAERGASLDPDAPCPTCGQALGEALAQVTAHHAEELRAAAEAHQAAAAARDAAVEAGRKLAAGLAERKRELDLARAAEQRAARAAARVESAEAAIKVAGDEVVARQAELERLGDPGFDAEAHQRAKRAAEALQPAAVALSELRGRAERGGVERDLAKEALERAAAAAGRATAVEAEAAALGPADQALADARERVRQAAETARRTHGEHQRAVAALDAALRRQQDLEHALEAARARHEEVAELEERAAYLARLADLMAAFRLHLVSRLGRRLSVEAAELFAELTDYEYQDLVVDPEDYSIRIADQGTEYELARYSGSENDLASLSLRVAVSLVIAEGAGELGLLVLDEVLGSLDRERRGRMLAALTTLQGRFRQVLLVTHNDEVKDLLPAAIEVRKGPHRTATVGLRG